MKKIAVMTVCLAVFVSSITQAETCLDNDTLTTLDARYENALRTADVKFLDKLLAPEFQWVHNLASLKESKTQVLARLQKPDAETKTRLSHDISFLRLGNTVVLQGLSSVDKWNPDGKTFRTSRYQFMRTYVEDKGECKLLAVQTMKIWSSEGD